VQRAGKIQFQARTVERKKAAAMHMERGFKPVEIFAI
jgi:hypothetical protein